MRTRRVPCEGCYQRQKLSTMGIGHAARCYHPKWELGSGNLRIDSVGFSGTGRWQGKAPTRGGSMLGVIRPLSEWKG